MADITFWFFVLITIGSALVVVLNKQLIYSAIALLFTLFGIAGIYVFLWADFIAGVQVIIYIGGIMVLIIFGIMLTNRITTVNISHTSVQRGVGTAIVAVILVVLGLMITRTPWLQGSVSEPENTTAGIGTLLLTDYLLPFEVASVLLLGALIGATMLSRKAD